MKINGRKRKRKKRITNNLFLIGWYGEINNSLLVHKVSQQESKMTQENESSRHAHAFQKKKKKNCAGLLKKETIEIRNVVLF